MAEPAPHRQVVAHHGIDDEGFPEPGDVPARDHGVKGLDQVLAGDEAHSAQMCVPEP